MADSEIDTHDESSSGAVEEQQETEAEATEAVPNDDVAPDVDATASGQAIATEELQADDEAPTDAPTVDKEGEEEQQGGDAQEDAEPAVDGTDGQVTETQEVEQVESSDAPSGGEAGASGEEENTATAEPVEGATDLPEGAEAPSEEQAEKEVDGEKVEGGEEEEAVKADGEAGEVTDGADGAEDAPPKEDGEEDPTQAEDGGQEKAAVDADDDAVAVGERLSRGGTPPADEVPTGADVEQDRPEATTPDKFEDEVDERADRRQTMQEDGEFVEAVPEEDEEELIEDEQEEEPAFRRQELIERYHEALAERDQLQQTNYGLQHKLAEYFKKKKADERQDYDKNVTDQEQRYLKYMAQLEDLRRQDGMEKQSYRAYIEDAKNRCQEKKERVDTERKKFMEFKKHVALNALNSRSGKPIPPKDIEQYMVNEVKKEHEVVNVRLENIKLKNKLKKKEQQLKSKEELAEGLHLIDFEQLKIENQTYNEKIEERNEELLKLRKKITSTVQVLTHLKEKLQFVQVENSEQSNELKEVEAELAQSRDILSRTKQARDALRIDNQKLRQNCGLLGSEPLLRDFEERKDEKDDLISKLEALKMRHAELTLHCNQVRRKIDQARLQGAV